MIWRVIGRAVNGAGDGRRHGRRGTRARAAGTRAPWHVPVPASVARLTSSRSWNPRSQTASRSATVVPVQRQTTPSARRRRQRARRRPRRRRRRTASPAPWRGEPVARVQAEVEHDRVARLAGAPLPSRPRTTTAATRGRRPRTAPARARPPRGDRSAGQQPGRAQLGGGARGDRRPRARLPGQTGWLLGGARRDHDLAGVHVQHPVGRAARPARGAVVDRRPPRRRRARRSRPRRARRRAPPSAAAAPGRARARPRRRRSARARSGTSRAPVPGLAGAACRRRPGGARRGRRGPALWQRARRPRRRSRTGSSDSRPPGRACRRGRDGGRPRSSASAIVSPARERHRRTVDRQLAPGGISRPRCHRACNPPGTGRSGRARTARSR